MKKFKVEIRRFYRDMNYGMFRKELFSRYKRKVYKLINWIKRIPVPDYVLKRKYLYITIGGAILFAYLYSWKCVHNYCAKIDVVRELPVFSSGQLIGDLNSRLEYLQTRTHGVGFKIHTVRMRENLWRIASRQDYTVHTIIGCNPQFETYEVNYKQKILLPSRSGVLHVIQENDDWNKIAKRYNQDEGSIRQVNYAVSDLVAGQMVFVPGAKPDMELMNEKMRSRYELRALFVSPLGGRFTSLFGMRKHPITGVRGLHGGIDIAVREGTWVGAASDGVVSFAGDGAGHYGKAVFIEHENGYTTHYGHLSKIYVRHGARVKARKLIAKSGSTGRSTGPHLHFTILKNGTPRDPLKFIW